MNALHKSIQPERTLGFCSPGLSLQWDFEKNSPLTPSDVSLNYSKKVWWTCEQQHSWEATPNSRNKNNTVRCPYCTGKRPSDSHNFAVVYPELLKYWDTIANGDVKPTQLLPQSHKVVWWTCEKGHSYDTSVAQKVRNELCPYCNGKRIGVDNNLAVLRPELLPYWNKDKNKDVTPEEIAPYSKGEIIDWKCEKGHEWRTSPNKFSNCPYCLNRKVDKSNSLKALHSSLSTEWHPTKNEGLTPEMVVPGSAKKVWWICSTSQHEWKTTVRHRAKRGTGCPECSKWIGTSFSEQSIFFYLKQIFPDANNRYRFENNGQQLEIDIYIPELQIGIEYDGYYYHKSKEKIKKDIRKNLSVKDHLMLLRIREKGLKPLTDGNVISYVRKSNQKEDIKECLDFIFSTIQELVPLSKEQITKMNELGINIEEHSAEIYEMMNIQEHEQSFGYKYPLMIPYWDTDKNQTLSPFYFRETNTTSVHWKCENGHKWKEAINNVVNRKATCLSCQSLAYNHPELLKQWDDLKNKDLNPHTLTIGSNQKAWWTCESGHSYERSVMKEINSKNCPYCINKLIDNENSICTTHPELVKEWHPTQNGDFSPFEISAGSGKSVWWQCNEGHEWKISMEKRMKKGKIIGCPYCRNQSVGYGNSLADKVIEGTIDSRLLEEWDKEKNETTPNAVLPNSSKRVWWTCENKHSWEAKIANRVNGTHPCPTCDSIVFHHPEVMTYWNEKKNKGLNPQLLYPTSKKKAWWTCKNGHTTQSSVFSKVNNPTKCDACEMIGFVQPDFYKEWDTEKNKDLFDPYKLKMGNDRVKVNWKCKHSHEWQANIYARHKQNNSCPSCKSLGFLNPVLTEELHPSKNKELNPFLISNSSGEKVWWQCKKGHEWKATVAHRQRGTECPMCPKGKVTDKNRLSLLFPVIARDWNCEKNEGYTSNDFSCFSSRVADWKCTTCDYEWEAKIADRTRGYKKCTKCT